LDVPLQVSVELGRTRKAIKEILALTSGSVIELDRMAGEPVDILVNGKVIAKGEVVVIDDSFGVRITDIISPDKRISNLK
jgi:flagellar motor switch protein FliN/FliY